MKVLVIKVSALGDIVHALPVLAHIYAAMPEATVDWLIENSFAPLLENHPLIRRVIRLDTRSWRADGMTSAVKGSLQVIGQLRREQYDVVLDLQGNSKSGLFTLLSGAPQRFGFNRDQAREWPNLLATNRKVPIPPALHHITSRYLWIAQAAVPGTTEVPLSGPLLVLDGAAQSVARQLDEFGLRSGAFIVAHYGTTWDTKLWPLECWVELVRALAIERGEQIVLTWGNDREKHAAEHIVEAAQGRVVIWPRGELAELVALLAAARLVIGADTGPIHLAAAVGTPTVSLYRVTDSRRNGPPGDRHIRLQAPMVCSPCLRKSCEIDRECGQSITVGDVLRVVDDLLGSQDGRV
jgi:heptosyltransferase-1